MKKWLLLILISTILCQLAFAANENATKVSDDSTKIPDNTTAGASITIIKKASTEMDINSTSVSKENQEKVAVINNQEITISTEDNENSSTSINKSLERERLREELSELALEQAIKERLLERERLIEEKVNMLTQREKLRINQSQIQAKGLMNLSIEKNESDVNLVANLSNGRRALIKVMPETASETALARLRMKVCAEQNNCTIELKEVGSGEKVRAIYEVNAEKQAKLLGIFATKMKVKAQVDAENGQVIQSKKPWWAFLAVETAE